MKPIDSRAMTFLADIEEGRLPFSPDAVPAADRDIMALAAVYLDSGNISARRMTRALGSTFDKMNASFRHHDIPYRIDL